MESQIQHAPSKKWHHPCTPKESHSKRLSCLENVNGSLCLVAAGTLADLQISSQVLRGGRELTGGIIRGPYICLQNTGWDELDGQLMLSSSAPAV